MSDATIEPFRCDHLAEVAALKDREQPGSGERWRHRFQWQYLDNPAETGDAPLGWVLVANGRLVGCKLTMPQRFWVEGSETLLRVSTDTIVDPAFRGKGFGKRLFERYFEACQPALSTSASIPTQGIFRACSGTAVPGCELGSTLVLRSGNLLRRKLSKVCGKTLAAYLAAPIGKVLDWRRRIQECRYGLFGLATVQVVSAEDERLPGLWESSRPAYGITAIRDSRFLTWRHGKGNSQILLVSEGTGEAQLFVAYVELPQSIAPSVRRARVLDVFGRKADSHHAQERLLAALRWFRAEGFDAVDLRAMDGYWREVVRRLGARQNEYGTSFMYVGPTSTELPVWHLVLADGDAGFWDLPGFPSSRDTDVSDGGSR